MKLATWVPAKCGCTQRGCARVRMQTRGKRCRPRPTWRCTSRRTCAAAPSGPQDCSLASSMRSGQDWGCFCPGPVAPGAPPRPHRQPPEAPAPRRAPPPPASVPAAAPAPPPPPPPRPSTSSDKPRQIPTKLLGNSGGGGSNKSGHLPKNPDDTATFYAVF